MSKRKPKLSTATTLPAEPEVSDHDAQVVIETEYLAKMVEDKFKLYRESAMFVNFPDPVGKSFYLAIATAIVGFTYMKLDQYHETTRGLKINV